MAAVPMVSPAAPAPTRLEELTSVRSPLCCALLLLTLGRITQDSGAMDPSADVTTKLPTHDRPDRPVQPCASASHASGCSLSRFIVTTLLSPGLSMIFSKPLSCFGEPFGRCRRAKIQLHHFRSGALAACSPSEHSGQPGAARVLDLQAAVRERRVQSPWPNGNQRLLLPRRTAIADQHALRVVGRHAVAGIVRKGARSLVLVRREGHGQLARRIHVAEKQPRNRTASLLAWCRRPRRPLPPCSATASRPGLDGVQHDDRARVGLPRRPAITIVADQLVGSA